MQASILREQFIGLKSKIQEIMKASPKWFEPTLDKIILTEEDIEVYTYEDLKNGYYTEGSVKYMSWEDMDQPVQFFIDKYNKEQEREKQKIEDRNKSIQKQKEEEERKQLAELLKKYPNL